MRFTALVLLSATLLSQLTLAEGATIYKSCPTCTVKCSVGRMNDKGSEAKNRDQCYKNMDDLIRPNANPKGWKLNWGNPGYSQADTSAWYHSRNATLLGVAVDGEIFIQDETKAGMRTHLVCNYCG